MIKNEKQYQITTRHLKDFKEVLSDYEKKDAGNFLVRLETNAVRHQIKKLQAEITEYESLQNGRLTTVTLNSLDDIPEILIKARLAKRWTQATLAGKVGLKEQQIQKYEATDYAGASVLRLQRIIDALEVTIPAVAIQINAAKFDIDGFSDEEIEKGQEKLKNTMLLCA